jgi:hypothetical protein
MALGAVLTAAVFAATAGRGANPATPPLAASSPPPPANAGAFASALPPGHPSLEASERGPHGGSMMMPNGDNQATPSIDWTPPSTWQSLPNPNPMRLATYKVADGAELSVARAGGSADANVQRWVAQFDGSPRPERSEKVVHGVKVTVVHMGGTFLGSGMGTTGPERHEGWAMLAAIAESAGSPYFFKLLGPSDQVARARAGFDALVDSIAPHAER